MAKVDTIELNINGKEYKYNINVGKEGIFRCHLDVSVRLALGLPNSKIEHKTLNELKTEILTAYHAFLESTTTFEAYIGILYKANGYLSFNSNGVQMFSTHHKNKFYQRTIGHFSSSDQGSCLTFGFKPYILVKKSTGVDVWHEASEIPADYPLNKFDNEVVEGLLLGASLFSEPSGVTMVPYSAKAMESLNSAKKGLAKISELLFNFMDRDASAIEVSLLSGNLLN